MPYIIGFHLWFSSYNYRHEKGIEPGIFVGRCPRWCDREVLDAKISGFLHSSTQKGHKQPKITQLSQSYLKSLPLKNFLPWQTFRDRHLPPAITRDLGICYAAPLVPNILRVVSLNSHYLVETSVPSQPYQADTTGQDGHTSPGRSRGDKNQNMMEEVPLVILNLFWQLFDIGFSVSHLFFPPNRFTCGGSILEKKRLDTMVGPLCCVGRGFGSARRAGLGWAWDLALLGELGWVGSGVGVWLWCAGLGWAWILAFCVWSTLYMSSSCLHDVFVFYFHVNLRCVSWGLSKTKPVIGEWNVVLSNSVFEKCDVKPTKWKQKVGNGSGEKGQHRQQCSSSTTTWQFQHNNTSWKWTASSQCNIEIADFVAEIEPNVRFCVEQN